MRVRLFLRTAEFLWQEGHTAHATKEEALEETRCMLDVYATFAEEFMAMPVIKGEKTIGERFPGADMTLSIEAMMQDRKALQAGTSHFLGQNFSKAQDIKFQNAEGGESFCWTTSWGLSTRMIGALIMTHSDDDGLVLPPKLAPKQVVVIPVIRKDEERATVMEYCESLVKEISDVQYSGKPVEVTLDARDMRGGEKKWFHVKRGVPIRVEVGPRDIKNDSVFVGRRDQPKSTGVGRSEFVANLADTLDDIQKGLFERALAVRTENTKSFDSFEDFKAYFTPKNSNKPEIHAGFAECHFVDCPETDEMLKPLKVTPRCIPLGQEKTPGTCIFTGKPTETRGIFAKSY
jgi:prolyl-tRNA synthetase